MSSTTLPAMQEAAGEIRQELSRVVVGQEATIEQLLVALLAGQHCLLESAPGSAKNLLVSSLARTLGLSFYRLHASPDLSPTEFLSRLALAAHDQLGAADDVPTLPHLVLIDDISRLVPATRVVIEQAMWDGGSRLEGQRFVVPSPFMVIATKYRDDEEPADVVDEPRDDRYMLKVALRFPSYQEEFEVTEAPLAATSRELVPVLDASQVVQFQEAAQSVVAPVHVVHYALRLIRSTRVHEGRTPDFAYEWIGNGAGPRASHHLLIAAKMRAAWEGRDFAAVEDIQAMIHSVLRHRLVANQNARANGITPDRIIDRLVYEIPIRIDGDDVPAGPGGDPKFDVTSDDQWMGE